MKNLYHYLIMSIPFVILFAFAGLGLEVLEGNKIRTSEYMGLSELGLAPLLILAPLAFVFYVVLFLPLTLVVNKFITSLVFKRVTFTCIGGILGAIAFGKFYSPQLIEEYNLSIISAIILFSIAGLLYSLIEKTVKKNIKFI